MKRLTLSLLVMALAAGAPGPARADDGAASVQYWVEKAQGWVVKTMACDGGLCGYLVSFRMIHHAQDYVPTDIHNPDPVRRAQPLCGLRLMRGFKPSKDEPGHWSDGWIYDPQSGATYSGKITLIDADTAKLRGYVAIPLFGRTLTLNREFGTVNLCSVSAGR